MKITLCRVDGEEKSYKIPKRDARETLNAAAAELAADRAAVGRVTPQTAVAAANPTDAITITSPYRRVPSRHLEALLRSKGASLASMQIIIENLSSEVKDIKRELASRDK